MHYDSVIGQYARRIQYWALHREIYPLYPSYICDSFNSPHFGSDRFGDKSGDAVRYRWQLKAVWIGGGISHSTYSSERVTQLTSGNSRIY